MPPPSRPRGFTGGAGGSSGRPAPNTPMSERQQMALLMQMTSSAASPSSSSTPEPAPSASSTSHGPARSRERNERGETALHVAAIKGDQDAVKKLLDSGMSPNVKDFAGWTPLHEACNYAHYNVALTLVKAGANVNAKGLDDDTPLHDAAINGHLKLVKMLVEKGADVNSKNRKGKTPADVAAASASAFLASVRDASTSSGRPTTQLKKPSVDQKKSSEEPDETAATNERTTNSSSSTTGAKEEEDVYEFKTTPKDAPSAGAEEKTDTRKGEKVSSDEKSTTEETTSGNASGTSTSSACSTGSTSAKRPYTEVEVSADQNLSESDENKRKKRKDSDNVKETTKATSGNRAPQRQEKASKIPNSSVKSISVASKSSASDRKSPCGSPKPSVKSTDSDAENDDAKSSENFGNGGPKVPPLKIVIPPQNASGDLEAGSRNGKSNSARNHAALPYVVASSSNSNDSLAADKDSTSSRCASPVDSTGKSGGGATGVTGSDEKNAGKCSTSEERAQQRVLRSSHRSGGSGVDRGSNNSSPQLQSCSASPAPAIVNETNEPGISSGSTTTPGTSSTASATGTNTGSGTTSSSVAPAGTNGKSNAANTSNSSPQAPTTNPTEVEPTTNVPSPSAATTTTKEVPQNTVELHPRKRKIRAKLEESLNKQSTPTTASTTTTETPAAPSEIHPHDFPFVNCYQMFVNIRKQIEKKHRALCPIEPRPPHGFEDYLMNRRTYVLAGKTPSEPTITLPPNLPPQMKDLFIAQEKERYKLIMQHIVEKEKLILTVEQEILRVHGKFARSAACQTVPFSVCSILKDEEVYNLITPEQEEKDRNARSRHNGRLFHSWLQDVDDKWEKIKEPMVLRHHNEAESLHAVQKMDWEWAMKEHALCDYKSQPVIDEQHVPMVLVCDDFGLLPAQ